MKKKLVAAAFFALVFFVFQWVSSQFLVDGRTMTRMIGTTGLATVFWTIGMVLIERYREMKK